MRLTASNIVRSINELPKDVEYRYVSPKTKGRIRIVRIDGPEGPIIIKRYNPSAGGSASKAREESISSPMIWRVANAFTPGHPIQFDRVLGGSYNTRSVLEALLAHTPQFYCTQPGRIESTSSGTRVKRGHKHLVWLPDEPHQPGVISERKTEMVISEVPTVEAVYDALVVPDSALTGELPTAVKRRHSQMQIALLEIGRQLGYRIWVAQNDKGIVYKGQRLGETPGVIAALSSEKLLAAWEDAQKAALMIDCIWFKGDKQMPAVIEIEHSTGVTPGLKRMKSFQDKAPPYPTKFVVVAPDNDRDKVLKEANEEQFRSLDTRFFPYSAVEELYALCQRRKIKGVTEDFLECFMEPAVQAGE